MINQILKLANESLAKINLEPRTSGYRFADSCYFKPRTMTAFYVVNPSIEAVLHEHAHRVFFENEKNGLLIRDLEAELQSIEEVLVGDYDGELKIVFDSKERYFKDNILHSYQNDLLLKTYLSKVNYLEHLSDHLRPKIESQAGDLVKYILNDIHKPF